jgi:cytidine deaminase
MQVMVEQPNDPNHAEPDLSRLAEGVLENAYAPYSRFKVGVAIRTQGGGVFPGCNVENVSFPVGICAERAAIAAAVAAEGPSMRVATLVMTARNAGEPAPCTPCGACRQAWPNSALTPRFIIAARRDGGATASATCFPSASSSNPKVDEQCGPSHRSRN